MTPSALCRSSRLIHSLSPTLAVVALRFPASRLNTSHQLLSLREGMLLPFSPRANPSMLSTIVRTFCRVVNKSPTFKSVSEAYNFSSTGEGAYTFEARNLFYIVNADNEAVPLYAHPAEARTTKLSGKLAVARPTLGRRASYVSCSADQQTQLVSAASQAQSYAASALSYVPPPKLACKLLLTTIFSFLNRYAQSHTSATPRYTTWFGTYTDPRHSTVVSHFSGISDDDFSSYTYDCSCKKKGTYAYVNPNV